MRIITISREFGSGGRELGKRLADALGFAYYDREIVSSIVEKCNLDDVLFGLHCDGYFDMITSERKGEKMYVITLKESGFAFKRTAKQRRRDVTFKILLALIGAVATFIFGLILRSIFG